jgi:UV radiation resistance-associated gene protein
MSRCREHLRAIRRHLAAIRTSLLSILASLFPIDLLDPPQLLFTILDIPLPIPLSSTDPAPPLSLPSYREENEESVATALGYAAHLVQLLAAYLGKGLIYPITFIGSRSLIRDGISTMVGPRMSVPLPFDPSTVPQNLRLGFPFSRKVSTHTVLNMVFSS